jgi:20S proteasome subunit beta 6
VFSYDAVGSFERQNWLSMGTGSSMATSVLDSILGGRNRKDNPKPLSKEESIALARRVMDSVAERDISTGDNLDLWILTPEGGFQMEKYELRCD